MCVCVRVFGTGFIQCTVTFYIRFSAQQVWGFTTGFVCIHGDSFVLECVSKLWTLVYFPFIVLFWCASVCWFFASICQCVCLSADAVQADSNIGLLCLFHCCGTKYMLLFFQDIKNMQLESNMCICNETSWYDFLRLVGMFFRLSLKWLRSGISLCMLA